MRSVLHPVLKNFRYYVWDTKKDKALILVTERQFEDLLKEINSALKLSLKITDQQREEGLVSRFPDHPLCRPRYLGRSRSKDEYTDMLDVIPSTGFHAAGESTMPPPSAETLEDFRAMMEELWEIQRGKTKAAKKKKQQERIVKQQSMTDQFKRVQRYLGLRPTAQDGKLCCLINSTFLLLTHLSQVPSCRACPQLLITLLLSLSHLTDP